MFIKEIIYDIEPGTLILGLKIERFVNDPENPVVETGLSPRIATLNMDGWVYPDPKSNYKTIRTLFYPHEKKPEQVKTYTKSQIKERGFSKCLIADPWNKWREYEFVEFKKGEPIGVHLGEFILCYVGQKRNQYNNLYSKILLMNGSVGYIVFETEDRATKKAELI